MSFPGSKPDNVQRVSAGVGTAGFAQDVVVATSHFIHDQPLTSRDRESLEACRRLLGQMLSKEVSFGRSSSERYLDAPNTVALLRKARAALPEAGEDISEAIQALDSLLAGQRTPSAVGHVEKLRETFIALGELNLALMTRRAPGQEGTDTWTPLIASSLS